MAKEILINAKTQRPSVCNAAESLLIHREWFTQNGEQLLLDLQHAGVKIIGDENVCGVLSTATPATDDDYATEFLSLTISVKVIESVYEAIEHVNHYGTKHSEAIITEDILNTEAFLNNVDAAAVYRTMHQQDLQMVLNSATVQRLALVLKNYMHVVQWGYLLLLLQNILFTEMVKFENKTKDLQFLYDESLFPQ